MSPIHFELLSDGRRVKLLRDFTAYALDWVVTVPAGFQSDFASVPRLFWRIIPPWGKYSEAAVVHDYLYRFPAMHYGGTPMTRKEADLVFLSLMKQYGVGKLKRTAMYYAVRIGGGGIWKRYRETEQREECC